MNEASWDRIARVALGVFLIWLGSSGTVDGGFGTFLGILGFVPLVTGLVGRCPLYAIFKFRRNNRPGKP